MLQPTQRKRWGKFTAKKLSGAARRAEELFQNQDPYTSQEVEPMNIMDRRSDREIKSQKEMVRARSLLSLSDIHAGHVLSAGQLAKILGYFKTRLQQEEQETLALAQDGQEEQPTDSRETRVRDLARFNINHKSLMPTSINAVTNCLQNACSRHNMRPIAKRYLHDSWIDVFSRQ